MSILLFRNHNRKAIREILKKIGKMKYESALKEQNLHDQPPISMSGFYLEFDVETKDVDIWHQYGGGHCFKIISAIGYRELPSEGWEMVWEIDNRKLLK